MAQMAVHRDSMIVVLLMVQMKLDAHLELSVTQLPISSQIHLLNKESFMKKITLVLAIVTILSACTSQETHLNALDAHSNCESDLGWGLAHIECGFRAFGVIFRSGFQ